MLFTVNDKVIIIIIENKMKQDNNVLYIQLFK